jgi:site-specific recombinase XerD
MGARTPYWRLGNYLLECCFSQHMTDPTRLPARLGRPTATTVHRPIAIHQGDQLVARHSIAPDLNRHPAFVYLARLAPGSRRTLQGALATVARAIGGEGATIANFPWGELRYQHTAALRASLWDRYAPATANKILAAVRGVLREAWRLRLIPADDYQRAIDVGAIRGSRPLRGRHLATDEIQSLFLQCASDTGAAGARDAALLGVLYGAGLRRAEVAALSIPDYSIADGALTVRGKGNKVRVAYLSKEGGAARALSAWLPLRGTSADRDGSMPIFTRLYKGGAITPNRLTPQAVLDVLRRRAIRAGLRQFSPHDVRRTFIGDLLDARVDLATVQQMAGHAQVTTTARYDRRGERARRAAADVLSVPYVAPKR